jgi:hypothetical protein
MAARETRIEHDGGVTTVETETDGHAVTIYFGSSYTLRLDEENVDKLRDVLYEASRDLRLEWNALMSDADSASDEELEAAGTLHIRGPSALGNDEKPTEPWVDNDPVNW